MAPKISLLRKEVRGCTTGYINLSFVTLKKTPKLKRDFKTATLYNAALSPPSGLRYKTYPLQGWRKNYAHADGIYNESKTAK